MHDDTDAGRLIPVNPPAAAIDYLGNGWNNEDDIAASWKFMTKQKNDLINGLRLENASWRNWAKQRHNLKTISPKSLNWLKDSDTTWLYGPLYKAAIDEFDRSRFGAQTVAVAEDGSVSIPTTSTHEMLDPLLPTDLDSVISTSMPTTTSSAPTTPPASISSGVGGARGYGLKSGGPLKPVLKHKTASELFKADTLFHVQSDLRLSRKIEPFNKARESAVFKQHRQPKLRFNDSVEQCVSIDTDVISEEDEEMLSDDNMGGDSSSWSNSNENRNDDEDARTGLNGRHEDEDGGLLLRISVARRPPRSIVRIDSTTLKAASLHGMQDEDLEDPEDATTTDDEDEEGLFDEPIYLGNPYTGSGTAYVGSRQDAPHEAALDDVSYTRPSPPSPSAESTTSADSSASSFAAFHSASSTPLSNSIIIEEQPLQEQPLQEQQQVPIQLHPEPLVQSSHPSQQQLQQQQQSGTYVVTHTSSPRTISTSFLEQPLPVSTTTSATPAPSAARTALASALEAEKAMAVNGGMQQRATDLVANVKGLVNWASSLVFNSSTF
ncbi:hypothetical protein BGZ96_003982 [Linnemannia gamsii]|uniref:Nitrogen regulatory protein areA GATA-like domain-containing protein n=2 Tax=Linnemannia TaxID=2779861 RepID=A0ABQ7JIN2_9FUNG|nr:hypothetical protein BGZ96_003982 [Linnemannia gamsii]